MGDSWPKFGGRGGGAHNNNSTLQKPFEQNNKRPTQLRGRIEIRGKCNRKIVTSKEHIQICENTFGDKIIELGVDLEEEAKTEA